MDQLEEFVLEDNLKPEEAQLIKQMLDAIAKYPDAIDNSFTLDRTAGREPVQGWRYRLSTNNYPPTPFRNKQLLPDDCTPVLLGIGFIEPERGHNKRGSWFCFTEAALEWHRQYGGLSADEIRKYIGRILYRQHQQAFPEDFDDNAVAQSLGVDRNRVRGELHVLLGAHLIELKYKGMTDFGKMRLTQPEGILWATGGFQPIGDRDRPHVSVDVALHVEVKTIIEQARGADVDPALLERFEARVRRVEEELEKAPGEGRFQTVKDLVETANESRDLLGSTVSFLAKHWDKIQPFADAAGSIT